LSFDDLVEGVENGFAVIGGELDMDHQQLNASGGRGALMYRVKKGRIIGVIGDARYMFRVPEFWKNLVVLGGDRSAGMHGITHEKGQPPQQVAHSVRAVAARFRNVAVGGIR
jgi:predicted Zn-dependent protease